MVLFLAPAAMENAVLLGYHLRNTRTLYGMLVLDNDRAGTVQRILQSGLTVVVPDSPEHCTQAWHDVLLALRALHHPVQRMGDYLSSLNQPTPVPPAAPPVQQGAGVGQ